MACLPEYTSGRRHRPPVERLISIDALHQMTMKGAQQPPRCGWRALAVTEHTGAPQPCWLAVAAPSVGGVRHPHGEVGTAAPPSLPLSYSEHARQNERGTGAAVRVPRQPLHLPVADLWVATATSLLA